MNITYFIGAGASFHSLPLIKTMNPRMKAFSQFLKDQSHYKRIKHEFTDLFIKELDEIIETVNTRTSIDAYAKELSLGNSEIKLLHLKAVLSSYLLFEQLIKPKNLTLYTGEPQKESNTYDPKKYSEEFHEMVRANIDKRYITFWGDHLDVEQSQLPYNIKIISWNYDMQFEMSYGQIKQYSLELSQQNLQVYPSTIKNLDLNKSCILKLNGTAGLLENNKKLINLVDIRNKDFMYNVELLFEILKYNYQRALNIPIFTFAWEKGSIVQETRLLAKRILEETEILVIIGYSFPSFNRSVDRELFSAINSLKKIYYQAPDNEMHDLLDNLDGINKNLRALVKPKTNLQTFFCPPEL